MEKKQFSPIINFLLGSGEFDGVWFGDENKKTRGVFWWRRFLREEIESKDKEIAFLTAKLKASEEVKKPLLEEPQYDLNSGFGQFTIPRTEFLLHKVKKIESNLIEWFKVTKYSQGDSYCVRVTNKGKWAISYSND